MNGSGRVPNMSKYMDDRVGVKLLCTVPEEKTHFLLRTFARLGDLDCTAWGDIVLSYTFGLMYLMRVGCRREVARVSCTRQRAVSTACRSTARRQHAIARRGQHEASTGPPRGQKEAARSARGQHRAAARPGRGSKRPARGSKRLARGHRGVSARPPRGRREASTYKRCLATASTSPPLDGKSSDMQMNVCPYLHRARWHHGQGMVDHGRPWPNTQPRWHHG